MIARTRRTARRVLRRTTPAILVAISGTISIACRCSESAPAPVAVLAPSAAVASAPSASAAASASGATHDASPPAREARSFALTLATANTNGFGKPNVWAHVPAAYREDAPLRVVIIFHGFNNCLESFVADAGTVCRPDAPARTAYDLPAQIERSRTGAVVVVPQLAYDQASHDPGVLDSAAGLEKLIKELIEVALAKELTTATHPGGRRVDEIERVALLAISGGFVALIPALSAFGGGDKIRDVYLLDAYYTEQSPIDGFLLDHLADFRADARRPRHLGIIHSTLETTRGPARGFARRLAQRGIPFTSRSEPKEPTVEELAAPVSIVCSSAEHDEIPKTDLAKAIAASGI